MKDPLYHDACICLSDGVLIQACSLGGIRGWGVSFGCAVIISSHLLLFIFIVHTQSKDVFVIFAVLCVRLYTVFHLELFLCVLCTSALNDYLLTYVCGAESVCGSIQHPFAASNPRQTVGIVGG